MGSAGKRCPPKETNAMTNIFTPFIDFLNGFAVGTAVTADRVLTGIGELVYALLSILLLPLLGG